ncbi:MAG: choice-of-anchor F family protein [Desulfuromusa sp.]|jgi:hypothetical protein|nr:choice-of-anchor F family protein [Desulfuromusa sp.]
MMKFKMTIILIATVFLAVSAQAGKITSEVTPATGAAGFGGWNLGNVEITLNGTGSTYNETTGAYFFSSDSDFTYAGHVEDNVSGNGVLMGYALAKDWPVGEPAGIKIINDDSGVKDPKPSNCIIATSYRAEHFLDSDDPEQVICSSPFQSHKRYKLAMLPATVDGEGSESVDLVFNVEPEAGSREYQVFQKINNWTGKRLQGFTIQVGFGIGESFQSVEQSGVVLDDLNISVPADIWSANQLANFSAGLFGPLDKHTGSIGFFDPATRAGFYIDQYVEGVQELTDTLTATTTLGSDYADVPAGAAEVENQFGAWLPNTMLPYGIFFDDDGNPETDAELLAWYGYNPTDQVFGWMGGSQDGFGAISDEEILEMGENLSYTMGEIDDLVNVGLNYVVTVGDVNNFPDFSSDTFTIRITPTAQTPQKPAPGYVDETPTPHLLFTSSDAQVLLEPKENFTVGSLLTARVGDADLNLDPLAIDQVVVDISTDSGLSETLTLLELGENRGVFAATLPEEFSNVDAGTTVKVTYVDEYDGTGMDVTKFSESLAIPADPLFFFDVNITEFTVLETITDGKSTALSVVLMNDKQAEEAATGTLVITGSDGSEFREEFVDLAAGKKVKSKFKWTADLSKTSTVEWTAQIKLDDGTIVDEVQATTEIEAKVRKNEK